MFFEGADFSLGFQNFLPTGNHHTQDSEILEFFHNILKYQNFLNVFQVDF